MPASDRTDPDKRLIQAGVTSLLILLIYVCQALGIGASRLTPLVWALLAAVLWCLLSRPIASHWPVKILFVALLLISLGSPTFEWDPRSIWMLHGKRIFVENSLYAPLDNYPNWTHNDYPLLVPALSAALAHTVGGWNEIFPKSAVVLALLPALLMLSRLLRPVWQQLLFCLLVASIGGTKLVDGYMDALLGVWLAATVVCVWCFLSSNANPAGGQINPTDAGARPLSMLKAWPIGVALFSTIAIITLTKNEGLAAAAIVVLAAWATGLAPIGATRTWAALAIIGAALAPVIAWKLSVSLQGVNNDLGGSDLHGQLASRAFDPESHQLIAKRLFPKGALALLFLATGWFVQRKLVQPMVRPIAQPGARFDMLTRLVGLTTLVYLCVLYAVYLSTPHDLAWHLHASANRIMRVPVMLCAVYLVLAIAQHQRGQPD